MAKECKLCDLKLEAHDFANHVVGKKHMKKLEAENLKKGLVEKSIYVSHMPLGLAMPEVVNFFTQFGAIERCKLESNFAIIEFMKSEPVNFLLSRPIWMGSHKLDIKKRRLVENHNRAKKESSEPSKPLTEIIFADLKTKLESQTTFDGEFAVFSDTVRPNEDNVEHNWKNLHSSLIETLRPSFPHCEVLRFGSSVTGLAFKGSDFDVYLDLGQSDNPKTLFNEVKTMLYRKRSLFKNIVPIPKAKTPIIKFYHVPTGINCDVSLKNGLGVINSRLIKRLLSLDVRIKPLTMIIKYWAKTFELTGPGKFTNYAVVMLIIFYLQQPNAKLLPTIAELRRDGKPEFRWNWQVNFDEETVIEQSTNRSTVTELVLGFFQFYLGFPFEDRLICPLDGTAHSRTDFAKYCADRGADPDFLALDRPVCLQDPIELDNNVTAGVSAKLLDVFLRFCDTGVEICQLAVRTNNKPFLLNLYTTVPQPLRHNYFHEIVISAQKTIRAGLAHDFKAIDDKDENDKFLENNWYKVAEKLIEETLTRVFKLKIQRTNVNREPKQQKIDATSDVHSSDGDKIALDCNGDYNVIYGRKSKGSCIDPSLTQIDKEALLSDEVIDKQKERGVRPTKIHFTCAITRAKNPVRLIIRLTDRGSAKKQFRPLVAFMDTKLPSIVDKELIRMLQYSKK